MSTAAEHDPWLHAVPSVDPASDAARADALANDDNPPPDDEAPTRTPGRSALSARAYTRAQLADLPVPCPLIADTLDERTVAVLAGPRGSLKSFVVISWALSVATGLAWLGRLVHAPGRALIVAAEGAQGMHQRIAAWEDAHQPVPDDALTVITGPVNLLERGQVDELAGFLRAGGYSFIALDTLARCMVGGDENSARDMGIVVDSLDRIRDATGVHGCVVAAHHTPRSDNGRPRGSSALDSGVDTIYMSEGDSSLVRLNREKRKDGPVDDTLNVCLQLSGASGYLADTRPSLTNSADKLMSVFLSAFSETGASKSELRAVADMAPATFARSLNSLVNLGLLRNEGTDKRPFYRKATA